MGKSKDLATRVGIDDNADATAITITSQENVGIGTSSPSNYGTTYTSLGVSGSSASAIEGFVGSTLVGYMQSYNGQVLVGSKTNVPLKLVTNDTVQMTIDGSGYVKTPNLPAFHAKGLGNTSSAGGTANGNEVLLFNGITYNNGSHYNASTGRFTAPCAGIYYFSYSLLYDNSFNNAGSAMLIRNASGAGEYGYVEGSNVDYMQVSASAVVSCSTGDYVDVYSYPAGWHIASESSFTGFMIG